MIESRFLGEDGWTSSIPMGAIAFAWGNTPGAAGVDDALVADSGLEIPVVDPVRSGYSNITGKVFLASEQGAVSYTLAAMRDGQVTFGDLAVLQFPARFEAGDLYGSLFTINYGEDARGGAFDETMTLYSTYATIAEVQDLSVVSRPSHELPALGIPAVSRLDFAFC